MKCVYVRLWITATLLLGMSLIFISPVVCGAWGNENIPEDWLWVFYLGLIFTYFGVFLGWLLFILWFDSRFGRCSVRGWFKEICEL